MGDLKKMMPKKLGFGCMRLPVLNGRTEEIDDASFCKMIDTYMKQGFAYFDTAYPYHNQKSEEAVRRCLVERYRREQFFLADKMPVWLVKEPADYQKLFDTQLARCGVEYFDFYLLHAMNAERAAEAEELGGFDFVQRMKTEGRIRHIGFSFHDSAEVLEDILKKHPEMEFVQLQINYYDWESENVQSRKCYEVAEKYGVPVIVMEPVKGGTLANMTGEPARILKELDAEASYASYAIRYAASLPNVMLVLSGMSNPGQLQDNTSYMKEFVPLSDGEKAAIGKVVEELSKMPTIACTKCRYCVEGCPKKIAIPDVFEDYNMTVQFGINDMNRESYVRHTAEAGRADDCIRCGKCEGQCPQHLPIRELLVKVAETFA
ncbi:MAG: aldo/keto reductase [Roseburia sp.]|nr:aldo/keto reductase [Roseburia sp.]